MLPQNEKISTPPPTPSTPAAPLSAGLPEQHPRTPRIEGAQRHNSIVVHSPATADCFPAHVRQALSARPKAPLPPRLHIPPAEAIKNLKRKRIAEKLDPIITRLRFRLAPICALPGGEAHPEYPETLLHYHVLSEQQLDSMARWYHQWTDEPSVWTDAYPAAMKWDAEFLTYIGLEYGDETRIRCKRRKFGKFIGLLGCQTPVEEVDIKNEFLRTKSRRWVKSGGDILSRRGYRRW